MFLQVVGGSTDDMILKYIHAGSWAAAVAVGGYIVMFPLRYIVNLIKERFNVLDAVRDELETQRTNCLTTIQNNGKEQLEILERMADTLDKIHTSQAELSGYVRAQK